MAFEVFTPLRRDALLPGKFSLSSTGLVRLTGDDVRAAGLQGPVVVLTDSTRKLIAFRAPRDEKLQEPTVLFGWGKAKICARISIKGALGKIGLDAESLTGRHDVLVRPNDQMIVLCFGPNHPPSTRKANGKRKTKKRAK